MANVLALTTPLMRQTVGFDRFNDLFESLLRDTAESFDSYPPYNIEKLGEDDYKITMAVAGFRQEDLNIVLQDGVLTVSGRTKKQETPESVQILHRGIASRPFERTFRLADYIKVIDADLQDGLLTVFLAREVPEEKKPRMIPIKENGTKSLQGKKDKA